MRPLLRPFRLAFFLCLIPCVLRADYNATDYYHAGLNFYRQKDYAQAEKYFKYAVKLDPANWRAHQMLGQSYYFENQKDLAVQEIGKSLELHPENQPLQAFYNSIHPVPAVAAPAVPTASAPTNTQSIVSVAGPGLPGAAIEGPGLPTGAIGGNGAPLASSSYIWDPAVDPYPLSTGPAMPLPKPTFLLLPNIYLTAAFDVGFFRPVGDFGYQNDHPYTSIPLRLHYQLDNQVSLVGGIEFWSVPDYSYTPDSYSGVDIFSIKDSDRFKVTPITLGFFIHSLGKPLSFDGGFSFLGMIYQLTSFEEEKGSSGPSYSYDDTSTSTNNGFTFGGILDADLAFTLDSQNKFAIFLDSKCYFTPFYDYSFGFASGSFSSTNSNTSSGVTTTSTFSGPNVPEETVGFFGMSAGLGLRGSF